jgi:hypothetical protein
VFGTVINLLCMICKPKYPEIDLKNDTGLGLIEAGAEPLGSLMGVSANI